MPVVFTLIHFPFDAINLQTGDTLHLGEEFPSTIPEDLKIAAKDVRLKEAEKHKTDLERVSLADPGRDPVVLSSPLKIAEKVLPGDVEWIKLDVVPDKTPQHHDCGWIEFYNAQVVIYYDKAKPLVTPTFSFGR
jgi:hypothetical protein